jgi:hypothetical protein
MDSDSYTISRQYAQTRHSPMPLMNHISQMAEMKKDIGQVVISTHIGTYAFVTIKRIMDFTDKFGTVTCCDPRVLPHEFFNIALLGKF